MTNPETTWLEINVTPSMTRLIKDDEIFSRLQVTAVSGKAIIISRWKREGDQAIPGTPPDPIHSWLCSRSSIHSQHLGRAESLPMKYPLVW